MLELKTNPKHIVIQKRTKSGKWKSIVAINSPIKMTFEDVSGLLNHHKNQNFCDFYRAVIIGKKTGRVIPFLNNESVDFYKSVLEHKQSFFVVRDKTTKNDVIFSNIPCSKTFSLEDMKIAFIERGGIKRASMRANTEDDGYLKVWDLKFRDKSECSVAFLEAS